MKKAIWAACLILCLIVNLRRSALAEEPYERHADAVSFGRAVAELNLELAATGEGYGKKGVVGSLVLFRSRSFPLDFTQADFQPMRVLYGPKGFSVLLCTEPDSAVEWLRQQDDVLCAEIDTGVSGCSDGSTSQQTSFHSWAADAAGFGEYLSFAGQFGSGTHTVAVIDSGTFPHPLIQPKLRTGGHDYIDNDDDSTNDLNGHGTRVAGIVADCTQEQPVYIYPIRVLDANNNGRTSNVISAVLEAAEAKADVINLSLSTFSQSELLESAIRSAISEGSVVVAAAGNYACDASEVTPACMTDAGIVVVGSVDENGVLSSFSNYGSSVDVYFYGQNITSCSRSGSYVADSGTSMAAPHIAALCAMIRLTHPSISVEELVLRMQGASMKSDLCLPSALAMVPTELNFFLSRLSCRVGDTLYLPTSSLPITSMEPIEYASSDPSVIEISDGVLLAKNRGQATITVTCTGFPDSTISVSVLEGKACTLALPSGLTVIDEEAFYGVFADRVVLPPGLRSIGCSAFDGGALNFLSIPDTVEEIGDTTFSGAVVLCNKDSAAYEYAKASHLQYVILKQQ